MLTAHGERWRILESVKVPATDAPDKVPPAA
jgi:hypothetical protein